MSEGVKVPLGSLTNRVPTRRSTTLKLPCTASVATAAVCTVCEGVEATIKVLQQALIEVSDENEVLRERVVELEAVLTQVEEENREKEAVIADKLRRRKLVCST